MVEWWMVSELGRQKCLLGRVLAVWEQRLGDRVVATTEPYSGNLDITRHSLWVSVCVDFSAPTVLYRVHKPLQPSVCPHYASWPP